MMTFWKQSLAAACLAASGLAMAQTYPAKPITWICLLYTSPSPRD